MKYTTKLGNGFITFDEDEMYSFAPKSFKQAFKMWFFGSLFVLSFLLIVFSLNKLLMWLFPC